MEINVDPMNPIQQAIGILIGGFIMGWIFESWIRFAVWIIAGGIWIYLNFIRDKTGAVKVE